jgi:hypothetical protein
LVFAILSQGLRDKISKLSGMEKLSELNHVFQVLITFTLSCFAWIFFRANNVTDAFIIVRSIFTKSGSLFTNNIDSIVLGSMGIIMLLFFEFLQERNDGNFVLLNSQNAILRWCAYITLIFSLLLFGVFDGGQFIYFQF